MTTAADLMTSRVQCVGEHRTLAEAARMTRVLDVGALPICGDDNHLHAADTDRNQEKGKRSWPSNPAAPRCRR